MKLDILCLFLIGFSLHLSDANEKNENVHTKNIPEPVQEYNYQHSIYKRSPEAYDDKREIRQRRNNNKEKERLIVHNHGDRFIYDPDYAHDKQNQQASNQKESRQQNHDYENDNDDFKSYLKNFKPKSNRYIHEDDTNSIPVYYDDGYKTSKSVHTEHFEVKELNPSAKSPDEKYIIRGGYKVQETDPFDASKQTQHLHTYDSPLSKIAASIYSKFDYINFPHSSRENEDYLGEEKEKEQEDSDHENTGYFSNFESNDQDGNKKAQDKKAKSNDEGYDYGRKNLDYYTSPSHEVVKMNDPENQFDEKDWEKQILLNIYGDYFSPTDRYVQKILPGKRTA